MDKIYDIFNKIDSGIPVALSRFNDGEMSAIRKGYGTVARGLQVVNGYLQHHLHSSLLYERENYYKGIPCPICFPNLNRYTLSLINTSYKYLTYAPVITNRNIDFVWNNMQYILSNKRVIWVGSENHDISKLQKVGIYVSHHITTSERNAWDHYYKLRDISFDDGDIVLLSCGPLGRVLACEWFERNNNTTFLEIGSLFDPLTRGVYNRAHKGVLPQCKKCN